MQSQVSTTEVKSYPSDLPKQLLAYFWEYHDDFDFAYFSSILDPEEFESYREGVTKQAVEFITDLARPRQ